MNAITHAKASDRTDILDFVGAEGTFYQHPGWGEAIAETFGHETITLVAKRAGAVAGVLPLVDRRSFLFGRALISTAFTVGGGVAAQDAITTLGLLEVAEREGRERRCDYVELRDDPSPLIAPGDWLEKVGVYDTFDVPIIEDRDARLRSIKRTKRANIRKGIAHAEGGRLKVIVSGDDDLFWRRYAEAQRVHGTPVWPRKWLRALRTAFGDAMELTLAIADGEPVAGVVSFYHRDMVHLYYAFIDPTARDLHAGDYLYWWMMGHARERGASVFDLGRSKVGSGSHAYKTHWGFTPRPLTYLYRMMDDSEMPDINPNNPKFAAMVSAWRRLPQPVANRLGPLVAGHLA